MLDEPRLIEIADDLVVVDKPSGWVVHATRDDEPHDLLAWLTAQGHHAPCSASPTFNAWFAVCRFAKSG
ncbi:MAG: hypothetical protein AAF602_25995, partial [Myxococcota bacterium]